MHFPQLITSLVYLQGVVAVLTVENVQVNRIALKNLVVRELNLHDSSVSRNTLDISLHEQNGSDRTSHTPVDGLDGKPHIGPFIGRSHGDNNLDLLPTKSRDSVASFTHDISVNPKSLVNEIQNQNSIPSHGELESGAPIQGDTHEQDELSSGKQDKIGWDSRVNSETSFAKHSSDLHTDYEDTVMGEQTLLSEQDVNDGDKVLSGTVEKSTSLGDRIMGADELYDEVGRAGVVHPLHTFFLSVAMVIFSEIGDKTFFIAALMAVRHSRIVVFSAAFSALLIMTLFSAGLGHAVPFLLPQRLTCFVASLLFIFFGFRLLSEGIKMNKNDNAVNEMKEVEQVVEEKDHEQLRGRSKHRKFGQQSVSIYELESGRSPSVSPSPSRRGSPLSPGSKTLKQQLSHFVSGINNLLCLLLSPAWVQTFAMTFLGEWGDRSQIATLAMASGPDYPWITLGAIIGHGICSAIAVIGGRAVAGRVSMKLVTLCGAVAFFAFGLIYLVESVFFTPADLTTSTTIIPSSSSSLSPSKS